MKIASSNVWMESSHQESSYTMVEQITIDKRADAKAPAAILELSKDGKDKSYVDSIKEYQDKEARENKQKLKDNELNSLKNMLKRLREAKESGQYRVPDEKDLKIKMIQKILADLQGKKLSKEDIKELEGGHRMADFRSNSFKLSAGFELSFSQSLSLEMGTLEIGTNPFGTTWQKITATSGFMMEQESTSFASKGLVKTTDGRSIDFNIEVSMSRAFMQSIDMLEAQDYIKTDPLIINLDSNVTSVSDQKFYFDLDSDGKKEQISMAGKGSGFLALDKNGDGIINDGSELFGTKSGDGFKDLAMYDDDGNGWIDENDSVFSKLKIWTKDDDGKDQLIDLLKADVGAIFLGNVDTQFSLKDSDNNLNAEVRKTGVYLKESTGLAGTIAHVDLAI